MKHKHLFSVLLFLIQIIWNSSTRAELLKFVDQQRASQGPDGSYDLTESHSFKYQALSKELHVGNVYLRVYNNQPDYEISEPEAFCVALLKFISELVQNFRDLNIQNKSDINGSVVERSEALEAQDRDISDQNIEEKSSMEEVTEESEAVKNLHMGLTSLQVYWYLAKLILFFMKSNYFFFLINGRIY